MSSPRSAGSRHRQKAVLIDAHAHCHSCFDTVEFLDQSQLNFTRAASELGCASNALGLLVLTQGSVEHSFDKFRQLSGGALPSGWSIQTTEEEVSLVAKRANGLTLILLAGRQIALPEGLELLALGRSEGLPEGRSVNDTMTAIRAVGGLPVLPWGFGKWWRRRGAIVEHLLEETDPGDLLLADSGTRAALMPRPRLLAKARRLGFRVIAGSDPLPFAHEIRRPGSFGCLVEGPFALHRPGASFRQLLGTMQVKPRLFGRGRPLVSFVRDQLAMQRRKRRG